MAREWGGTVIQYPQRSDRFAVFYDDSPENLKDMHPNLLCIRVHPSTEGTQHGLSEHARAFWANHSLSRSFRGGMTTATIRRLEQNVSGHMTSVLLDFDCTVSLHSSINADALENLELASECYFGSDERRGALRDLFHLLRSRRIPLHILSSNPFMLRDASRVRKLLSTVGGGRATIHYARDKKTYVDKNARKLRVDARRWWSLCFTS